MDRTKFKLNLLLFFIMLVVGIMIKYLYKNLISIHIVLFGISLALIILISFILYRYNNILVNHIKDFNKKPNVFIFYIFLGLIFF